MSCIRSALALVALGLFAVAGHAQTNPAVSTIVAFSLSNPVGNLVQGADGALYGVASPATSITGGVIYRTTLDGSDVRTLYQLKPDDALSPAGGLVLASDGLLYGTTKFGQAGQVDGAGSIFKIAAAGTGFQIIHRFAPVTASNQDGSPINTNGAYPEAELVEGGDGYLYGSTRAGGANGTGTIFKISRDGTDFKSLYSFAAVTSAAGSGLTVTVDGAAPAGPLVAGADNFLYGTASQGGTNGRGTVFRIAFDGTGFQVLHHFQRDDCRHHDGAARERGRSDAAWRSARRRRRLSLRADCAGRHRWQWRRFRDPGGWLNLHRAAFLHRRRWRASGRGADGGEQRQALWRDLDGRRQFGRRNDGAWDHLLNRPGGNQFFASLQFRRQAGLAAVEQIARDGARRIRRHRHRCRQLQLRHGLSLQPRGRYRDR